MKFLRDISFQIESYYGYSLNVARYLQKRKIKLSEVTASESLFRSNFVVRIDCSKITTIRCSFYVPSCQLLKLINSCPQLTSIGNGIPLDEVLNKIYPKIRNQLEKVGQISNNNIQLTTHYLKNLTKLNIHIDKDTDNVHILALLANNPKITTLIVQIGSWSLIQPTFLWKLSYHREHFFETITELKCDCRTENDLIRDLLELFEINCLIVSCDDKYSGFMYSKTDENIKTLTVHPREWTELIRAIQTNKYLPHCVTELRIRNTDILAEGEEDKLRKTFTDNLYSNVKLFSIESTSPEPISLAKYKAIEILKRSRK